MTPIELIGAAVTLIAGIITGILTYRQHKLQQDTELQREENTQQRDFIDDAMSRVEKLELRVDMLTDRVLQTAQKAEEERRAMVQQHETKISEVQKEMRRHIDNAQLELSTWRDRYFTVTETYQVLKLSHANLQANFDRLDKEYKELRGMYRRRIGDSVDIEDRRSPEIEATP